MMQTLLVALTLLSAPELQQDTWGFTVFDENGTFITAKWPRETSFIMGSSPDAYVTLDGLEDLHAYFELKGKRFKVRPMYRATVRINGTSITGDRTFGPTDVLNVGRYRVSFYLADAAPAEVKVAGEALDQKTVSERAIEARKPEFERPGYSFCQDEDFGKDGTTGVDFCVLFDETTDEVCPEARKSCPNWQPYQGTPFFGGGKGGSGSGGGGGGDVGTGGGGGKHGGAKGGGGRRIQRRKVVIPIPKSVGTILLLLVGGALLFWFVKSLMGAGWEGEELDFQEENISEAAKNLQALPEARSNVLVKLAERALKRGDGKEAAVMLHLAILRHLDDEGVVRYHPSKTNGDYLRAIRRDKPMRDLLRGVATETERVRFGDGMVSEEKIASLIASARALLNKKPSATSAAAAAPLALLLLALTPGLSGCPGPDEEPRALPAYHAHGPTGMSALPAVLRDAGLDVSVHHGRLNDVPNDVGVVVLRTSSSSRLGWPRGMRLDELMDRNVSVVVIDDRGMSPFFLPTKEAFPKPGKIEAVSLSVPKEAPTYCSGKLAYLSATHSGEAAPVLPRGRRIVWDGLATRAMVSDFELHLSPVVIYRGEMEIPTEGAAAVAFAADRFEGNSTLSGCMYVFSDRDLFTNASLTRASNASFVASMFASLTPAGQRIQIMDRIDRWSTAPAGSGGAGGGGGSGGDGSDPSPKEGPRSPAETMKASNMLPFVLQSMATLILLFLFVGAAFGPLRDKAETEHKAFVEHVEAIGRQYARTGERGLTHSAHALARLVVMRHRDRVRGGPSGGWGALAKHMAEKHSLPQADVEAALRLGMEGKSELGTPRLDDPKPHSRRMLTTLSRLLDIRSKDVTEKPKARGWLRKRSG